MSSVVHDLLKHEKPSSSTIAGDIALDDNVIRSFPAGTRVVSANKFGQSKWTVTARLDVTQSDGTPASYFLKCAAEDAGRVMMEGEFNGMSELYKTMPELVPKPVTWGKFSTAVPETYFFLAQFIDMSDRVPEPNQLCSKLAKLHRISESPTGKFGFHITTCQGRRPQAVAWESSWTIFFSNLLRHVIAMDDAENGSWDALIRLEDRLLSHVVPYLLDNLTKDGRVVKPCLIHGDLWEGNTGTSYATGQVYLFDAAVMYAHNEFEIGDWRCDYNKIHNKIYARTYLRHYGPSEPREEWDDRNRAFDDMYYLIDKFAAFPENEGPPRLIDAHRAELPVGNDHTKA
ncbi:hypothetical protein LTR67_003267 [Exophiala xenobiotica]